MNPFLFQPTILKIFKIVSLCLLFLVSKHPHTLAQISKPGIPISFDTDQGSRLSAGESFKIKQFAPNKRINNEREKEKSERDKDSLHLGVEPYGVGIDINIDVRRDGEVTKLEDGGKLWLIEISSQDAFGLQLYFKRFRLPKGAHLFIYSKDKSMRLGAYTHENNNPNNEFAIQVIKGETLILEYYEPKKVDFSGELKINKLIHAFKPVFQGGYLRSGFGSSGLCHINVNCEPIYGEESKAVTRISIYNPSTNNTGFVSGALINSVAQKPYVLTANHAYLNTTSANQYFSSWIFYFNYEFPGCTSTTIEPTNTNTVQGVYLRSRGGVSDYMLLELPNNPKNYYPVNYLGWDVSGFIPNAGVVCIQHPDFDVKKIALSYTQPPVTVKTQLVTSTHFIEVAGFPENDFKLSWDEGITSGGSSGSPLIDMQSKKIIGQLHGGNSICSGSSVYYSGPDYFGRLSISWQNPDAGYTQLRNFLAGSGSTLTSLNGDYNGGPGSSPYVIIRDITLSTNAFELPKNKLVPQIEVYGNTGNLTYSWTPSEDFSYPNLRDGVITFGYNPPPVFPVTRTYTLNVIPEHGVGASKSITVTLYDCQTRTFNKHTHLNIDLQLGRAGSEQETYSWAPVTNLSNPNIPNPVFHTTSQGVYNYTLTATSAGCTRQEKYSIYAEDGPLPSALITGIIRQNTISYGGIGSQYRGIFKIPDGYLLARTKHPDSQQNPSGGIELVRINNSLNEASMKTIDNTFMNSLHTIVRVNDGGFVLTGLLDRAVAPYGVIDPDIARIVKIDADLNIVWAYDLPETYYINDNGKPVTEYKYWFEEAISTSDGGLLVVMKYHGYRNYSEGKALWKFSATGARENQTHFLSGYTFRHYLCQLSDGSYLITGKDGPNTELSEIRRYTSDLNHVWTKSLSNGVSSTVIRSLTSLPDNTIIVGINIVGEFGLVKLDADGTTLWNKRYGGSQNEFLNTVIRLNNGNLMAGGWSTSNANGYKSENSRGKEDYWILKLDENGNYIGDNTYGGSEDDGIFNIIETDNGKYLIAGYSNSPVSGDKTVPNMNSFDAWLIEIEEGICTTPQAIITTSGSTSLCGGQTVTLTANEGSNLNYKWYHSDQLIAQTRSIVVTNSNPGTYRVSIFRPNSCETSASIQVNALQVTVIASGPLCTGSSVTLSPLASLFTPNPINYVYKWQRYTKVLLSWKWVDIASTNDITVNTEAKYRVIVYAGGCSATSPDFTLTAVPNPKPAITYSGDVCVNGYLTLTASTGASYQWSNGLTTRSINGYQGGNYYVTVTNSNGCVNTSNYYQVPYCNPNPDPCDPYSGGSIIEPCMMLMKEGTISTEEIAFYPNPTDDKLIIQLPHAVDSNLKIRIYSQLGREELTSILDKGETYSSINVGNLAAGVYFVDLVFERNQYIRRKIVIVR